MPAAWIDMFNTRGGYMPEPAYGLRPQMDDDDLRYQERVRELGEYNAPERKAISKEDTDYPAMPPGTKVIICYKMMNKLVFLRRVVKAEKARSIGVPNNHINGTLWFPKKVVRILEVEKC
jgi:hypothetical protein